jgi:hypothetical protein
LLTPTDTPGSPTPTENCTSPRAWAELAKPMAAMAKAAVAPAMMAERLAELVVTAVFKVAVVIIQSPCKANKGGKNPCLY